MQSFYLVVALFLALAGHVLGLDVPFGNAVLTHNEILAFADNPVSQACAANCTLAKSTIAGCANDNACLCRNTTVSALWSCETCMLHTLIARNIPAPDPRVGSNVVQGGFVAACTALNITVDPALAALTLPASWDGPFVAVLPFGGAIVVVVTAAILGGSALYLLSNM